MTFPIREHDNEQDDALERQIDKRAGPWTRLDLIEMDVAFCSRLREVHPERENGFLKTQFLHRRPEAA